MLARPEPTARVSRPDLTCRRIHVSPQITAITIRSPTIVRTRLGPPELACVGLAGEESCNGVFSLPVLEDGVNPCAGHANASAASPAAGMAAPRAAPKCVTDLVIEGRLRGESLRLSAAAQVSLTTQAPTWLVSGG